MAKQTNQAEVDRLLAESDSSSDDNEPALGGIARDSFMENMMAQRNQRENNAAAADFNPKFQATSMATQQTSTAQKINNRSSVAVVSKPLQQQQQQSKILNRQSQQLAFSSKMNAEEILNAVSSDSDADDVEVEKLIQAREEKKINTAGAAYRTSSTTSAAGVTGFQKGGPPGPKDAEYDFYLKNMNDPAVREKFINNQLDLSSSDSSGEDDNRVGSSQMNSSAKANSKDNTRRQLFNTSTSKLTAQSPSAARSMSKRTSSVAAKQIVANQYDKAGPVTLVELNERQSQHTPEEKLIEAASQLLSFDKEFYNVKKELFNYSHFQQISKSLYDETSHQYYGLVSCVRMFRAKNGTVIFVGNSAGYIRVFDIQTQRQMRPLYDDSLFQNKVLCIDISEDGHYLLAGYKNGNLVLWDSAKYKKAHAMNDVAKNSQSDFSMVKLLYTNEQNVLVIVTAEEMGRVRLVHVTKTFLGNYSHKANSLYESDLKGTATISVQRPSSLPSHYSPFCDVSCLTAFGATNMITIVEMKQFPPRPIKTIKRPAVCKEKSVPSIDWGYGLTPQERERTIPLMAIAWDKVIQLLYVNDQTKTIEFDGYYCCDKEINQVYFMADSVLVILVNQDEMRVLYTEKFQPGDVSQLAQNRQHPNEDIMMSREFKATVEGTKASELETGHTIKDIKPGVVTYQVDRLDGTRIENKVMNFNNTICQYKKNIIFVGASKIYRARLLSWREFIDKLKFTDNHDWLTVLKVALEIYNGEIKGFALLPDAKERRQSFLKDYMKKLILTSIQTVIFKFKNNHSGSGIERQSSDSTHPDSDSSQEEKDFSIDKIAIKVSIEFCLQISEVDYLFTEIYRFFVEKDLEDKFIGHLCAPIIAGQFRSERIPEHILQKLVRMYEDRQEFKILEKIILNVNVECYQKRGPAAGGQETAGGQTSGKGIRSYLEVVCKSHCMVSALLQLQTSDRSKHVREGCSQILNMLLNNMETQKAVAEQDQLMNSNSKLRKVQKQDIYLLRNADKNRKYEIEQSAFYIGYKLLWILGLFLQGKKFPSGNLLEASYQAHVLNIVDFVTDEQTLAILLDFDAKAFFETVQYLFCEKPWHYLVHKSHKYIFEFQKDGINAQQRAESAAFQLSNPYSDIGPNTMLGNKILLIFKQAAERTNRKDPGMTKSCFLELILNVVVSQHKQEGQKEFYKLEIDYEWVVAALKSVLAGKCKQQPRLLETVISGHLQEEFNQDLIIDTLKAVDIKPEHLDELIELITPNSQLTKVKIQLFESKQDHVEAFMLHLNNESLKKTLFPWLFQTFEKLTKQDHLHRKPAQKANEEKLAFDRVNVNSNSQMGNMSESQRIRQSILNDDDEEESPKAEPAEEVKVGEEFPPLTRLKRTVKARILELAKQNSEQTVQLVETYLSDGDFQERLITEQFSRFEGEQLNYLTSYITKNEEAIKRTLREDFSSSHQAAAQKYEKYLILFTKLLCKLNVDGVDTWVSKSYFPPDKCLPICKEYGNLKGEAILTMRGGKHLESIDVYLKILTEYPVHNMLAEFKLLYKDRPSFLDYTDEQENEDDQQLAASQQSKFAFTGLMASSKTLSQAAIAKSHQKRFVPDSIILFDQVLGKACSICNLDDLDSDQRMKGWFQILRYLQNFMVESFNKVNEGLANAKKEHKVLSLAGLNEDDKPAYISRLKDFIMDRINYILKYPGLDIPLKMIVEQLNLTFEQLQQLCASKMVHNGTTLRIEQTQQMITVRQHVDIFEENLEKMSTGFLVEPNKRFAPNTRANGRRLIKAHTICNQCMSSIVRQSKKTAEPIIVYQCMHQYHSSCLTEKQKELGAKKCPICLKQNYMAIREEREKIEQRQRKRTGRRPGSTRKGQQNSEQNDDEESDSSGAATSGLDNSSGRSASLSSGYMMDEESSIQNTVSLMHRKLEQYESLLGDSSFQLSDFEEAMLVTPKKEASKELKKPKHTYRSQTMK